MSMFKEVADIKTSDQLHLPVPEAKFETVVAKPSEIQKEMVQELERGIHAERLVGCYTEIMPGRPTIAEHRQDRKSVV